jgi:hypothetical protein
MTDRKRKSLLRRLQRQATPEHAERCGEALYVRPFADDDLVIDELVRATGERRSRVAQKLIRAGIAGNSFKPDSPDKIGERVEWLAEREKQRYFRDETVAAQLARIEQHLRATTPSPAPHDARHDFNTAITAETFCLVTVAVGYLGQLFAMLPAPVDKPSVMERKRTDHNALRLVEYAVSEFERLLAHHTEAAPPVASVSPDTLFFMTKIAKVRARLAELTKTEFDPGEPHP